MSTNLKLCGDVWRMTSFCRWRHMMSWVTQIEKKHRLLFLFSSFSSFFFLVCLYVCVDSHFQCYFLPSIIPQQKKNPFDMWFPPLKIHTQQHPGPVGKTCRDRTFRIWSISSSKDCPFNLGHKGRVRDIPNKLEDIHTQQAISPTIYVCVFNYIY